MEIKSNEKELERKIQEEDETTFLKDLVKSVFVPGYALHYLGIIKGETNDSHKIDTNYVLAGGVEVMKGLMYLAAFKGVCDMLENLF